MVDHMRYPTSGPAFVRACFTTCPSHYFRKLARGSYAHRLAVCPVCFERHVPIPRSRGERTSEMPGTNPAGLCKHKADVDGTGIWDSKERTNIKSGFVVCFQFFMMVFVLLFSCAFAVLCLVEKIFVCGFSLRVFLRP